MDPSIVSAELLETTQTVQQTDDVVPTVHLENVALVHEDEQTPARNEIVLDVSQDEVGHQQPVEEEASSEDKVEGTQESSYDAYQHELDDVTPAKQPRVLSDNFIEGFMKV